MGLTGLFELIHEHSSYKRVLEDISSRRQAVQIEASEAARPFLVAALWHHLAVPVLVILPRPEEARRFHDSLLSYLGEEAPVHLFPEPDVLPFERLVADAATNNQRMLALAALIGVKDGKDGPEPQAGAASGTPLVVASTAAAPEKDPPTPCPASLLPCAQGGGPGASR